jgi:hypothetical protein
LRVANRCGALLFKFLKPATEAALAQAAANEALR